MYFPTVDKHTDFYKNCAQQRKRAAKICQSCPFRAGIESQEKQQAKLPAVGDKVIQFCEQCEVEHQVEVVESGTYEGGGTYVVFRCNKTGKDYEEDKLTPSNVASVALQGARDNLEKLLKQYSGKRTLIYEAIDSIKLAEKVIDDMVFEKRPKE